MKEYICKYCGKKFEKYQQLGGHVLKEHRDKSIIGSVKQKKERVIEYYKNPTLCKNCKNLLSYEKRHNKFCSHSCSASYNNKGIRRHGESPTFINCLNCNKEINDKHYNRKYCSSFCHREFERKQRINKWLREGGNSYISRNKSIREYLLNEQNSKCAICGINNEWNGKPMIFICDHIDGNSNNNLRENLRMICSNCDSQLDTYKAKNKKSGRYYRMNRYREGKSY